MSPSMEKERIDHQVLNSIFSGTEPDRNTLAKYQIRLAAFFGISVYKRLERCVGTHPEKLWVKIPNYFCLSAYFTRSNKCALSECRSVGWGVDQNVFIRIYNLLQVVSKTKATTRVNSELGMNIIQIWVCGDKVTPLAPSKHAVFDVGIFFGKKRTNALAGVLVDNDIKGD